MIDTTLCVLPHTIGTGQLLNSSLLLNNKQAQQLLAFSSFKYIIHHIYDIIENKIKYQKIAF